MSDSDKQRVSPATDEPATAPRPPLSASRIDMMTEEFARLLSRRAYRVGDVLAERYRILDRLGDGGMGQVFVAENLSIGSRVAIKVLKAELLADEAFRQRFQHEAEAVAAIEHQNVVRFFDLVVGDPTFLVMEHLVGPTLSAVLKEEKRLPLPRALAITRRLCWGLDAAHRAGIVHRDIKPSNIILVANAQTGEEPKLIDFGVAKVASRPTEQQLTLAGQLVGTPHYMSPEQITGEQVDARADVYALGCLLYHMVGGQPPFTAAEEFKILTQHISQKPAPLSRLADVPHQLDVVLARALAKDPKERFASTLELAAALDEVKPDRTETPAAANPAAQALALAAAASAPPAVARPAARYGLLLAAALLSGAIGFGGAWWLHSRRAPAVAPAGGLLIIATDPSGATVELDGAPIAEKTPTAVRGVGAGPHTVIVRQGTRPPLTRKVVLAAGERAVLELNMPPSSHPLEIQTAPNGARVYLDRSLVDGVTPLTVEVVDDDLHELRIEKLGFEPLVQTLTPEDREPTRRFELTAEKLPRGRLIVDANANAEVWIDGADTGFSTPTISMPVLVGAHRVELRRADGSSAQRKINVRRGETLRMMMTLVAASGKKESP